MKQTRSGLPITINLPKYAEYYTHNGSNKNIEYKIYNNHFLHFFYLMVVKPMTEIRSRKYQTERMKVQVWLLRGLDCS